ncbi:phosphonate C-P lyase system protein PhnG [Falsirhodobacter algicola]|uniref:Phosphonate C-P lyase system protein PhnG n=1 Tax=Falsirhodobacter algicola TaxID=2692330 RepID=A0A8J8MV41_9RHOB|nr:phosphonate C-P lyase system protein PhnG [Falsirhodobacter algicola]QUS37009.1 phosphonate C-P lyase system protein PhnG [Falsirhodobacter algicola]
MDLTDRSGWMGLLARAAPAQLAQLLGPLPEHRLARAPQIGTVMVQGRMGGTGAPFNLGEMPVTRCTLRLASGTVGHAYVQGRDLDHARRAAIVDAMMQDDPAPVRARILRPLAEARAEREAALRAKAAATRVEFFTLARAEA